MNYMQDKKTMMNSGNYAIIPLYCLSHFSMETTLAISYLLSVGAMKEAEGEVEDGFFRCSSQHLQSRLRFSRRKERYILLELEQLGILERKMMGNPARRYMKLNMEKVEEILDEEPIF